MVGAMLPVKAEEKNNEDRPVKLSECNSKHNSTRTMVGFLIALTAVFLGLIVLAASVAVQAAENANNAHKTIQEEKLHIETVRNEMKVHMAEESANDKVVLEKLAELKVGVDKLQDAVQEHATVPHLGE